MASIHRVESPINSQVLSSESKEEKTGNVGKRFFEEREPPKIEPKKIKVSSWDSPENNYLMVAFPVLRNVPDPYI
ncbi:MAG: hypothetical protein ACRDFB_10175, partial [Rhabdochlamydiaceae bacterium]